MSEKKQNLWKCFIVVAVGILCIAAGYAWAKNSLIMKKTDWQGTFQVGEHKFENAESYKDCGRTGCLKTYKINMCEPLPKLLQCISERLEKLFKIRVHGK